MRRSTIDVPLACDLRDGGDGGRWSKHHPPSTPGINLGSLRSTHITPAYATRARRDTSRCSVALPRCRPRQAALLGIPQCRDAAGACPSREGAGSQSRLKRIRRAWYRRICNLSSALSRVTPHSLDQRSAAESRPSVMARTWGTGCAVAAPRWKHIGLYRVEVYTPSTNGWRVAETPQPMYPENRTSHVLLLSSYTRIQTRRLIYIVPPRGQHQTMIDLGHAVAWTGTSTPPNPRDARALGPPKARSTP